MTTITAFDPKELESKVKAMYRSVAEDPHGEFHFEMGRAMAERLGYAPADLDRIPAEAIESFAGVGYYFHLADLKPGEMVVDLGSGSGMDTFIAALKVGPRGKVTGVDMTDEQRAKAERLRNRHEDPQVGVVLASKGYPSNVETGQVIRGLDDLARECPDALVFHAGTRAKGEAFVSAGGRVLTIVGRGSTFEAAIARAYDAVAHVQFDGMHYRRDIGRTGLR